MRTLLKIFIISVSTKTFTKCFLNILYTYSYFSHTILTAWFKFSYFSAFISNIRHPSPPFLRCLFQNNHLSNLLTENILSISTLLFSILITTIFLSKIAILFWTKWTILGVINNFKINEWIYFLVKLLEIINKFIWTTIVLFK